jgi:uncharacterized protein YwgA
MRRLQKAAVIVGLADALRNEGSWCGETHLQKATFFLKELFDDELDFEFILYKHGPFSFELREELMSMRADGLLKLEKQPYPYGPRLAATESGEEMKHTYPKTLRNRHAGINFVAQQLGSKDVNQLERVATALWVTRHGEGDSRESRAREINSLKPHVSIESALQAVDEVDAMLKEADQLQAA